MQIDLHVHSDASDGTQSPAAVMREALRAGLDVVALTDHDTVAGWDEAADAAAELGIGLVRGIEITCEREGTVHLLAYLPAADDDDLMSELGRARKSRLTRMDRMVERLALAGIPITIEQVHAQVREGATLGRPHLADALVAAGEARDRTDAFVRYLDRSSRFYVGHYAPDPVRAVELVVAAGGVAVIAHPFTTLQHAPVPVDLIADMAAAGMLGIEVDHRDHDASARRELRGLAAELGLVVTGSSDYHGAGKPNLIGENRTDPEAFAAIVAAASGCAYLPA